MAIIKGKVFVYGHDVNTDVIFPGKYTYTVTEPQEIASHSLEDEDPDFIKEVKPGDIIIAGKNFGCGSSREHAAINPMFLGVKCVIAKSIARIHKGNLVNHGIIPMLFEDPAAYDSIDQGDELRIENLLDQIPTRRVVVKDVTKHFEFTVKLDLTDNEIEVVLAGGQLRYLRRQLENM